MGYGRRKSGAFTRPKWKDPIAEALKRLEVPIEQYMREQEQKSQSWVSKEVERFPSRRKHRDCVCGGKRWIVVKNHESYRDPFLECGSCGRYFRMDMTPLDLRYAWNDSIKMPKEILKQHEQSRRSYRDFTSRFSLEQLFDRRADD